MVNKDVYKRIFQQANIYGGCQLPPGLPATAPPTAAAAAAAAAIHHIRTGSTSAAYGYRLVKSVDATRHLCSRGMNAQRLRLSVMRLDVNVYRTPCIHGEAYAFSPRDVARTKILNPKSSPVGRGAQGSLHGMFRFCA